MNQKSPAQIEFLEGRSLLASSSATVLVSGHIDNVFALTDDIAGTTRATALADRAVFDDANHNGKLDAGEPSALTNLDGRYQFKLSAGGHRLRLAGMSGWAVPAGASGVRSITLPSVAVGSVADGLVRVNGPNFSMAMIAPAVVDVAIAYTSAAANGRDDVSMLEVVRQLLAEANRPYANSDTNVMLNLVRVQRTSYRESGSLDKDLDRLQDATDGRLDDVSKLRDRFHADIAVLLDGGDTNAASGDTIGLAFEYQQVGSAADYGFAAISLQNEDTGDNADWITLAHEVGHTLGAGHDFANADDGGLTDYAYGYSYTGTDGQRYNDVMSYGSGEVLPFFSTPNYSWAGKAIGKKANADNARVIRSLGPTIAQYR